MADSSETSPYIIRRATRDDVVAIVRLLADDLLGQQREQFHMPLPETYYTAFEEIDQTPCHELVVTEINNKVIGVLQLSFLRYLTFQGGKRAQIEGVRVDQRYRSSGVGHRLFVWAIERARQEQCHLIQLTTNKSRPEALRFYERLGFVASHEGLKLDLISAPTT
ncbi:MAG: GNAT family N-acetyltransferase [Chloroflexi bacterium AL-N10]|nr:GNAT family N-acetyltransferase [Chloroflexi bacterium AL-N1]NOK66726.1 GNAT family N-acetyltransferase [Chloroflexi bacterium AL-N10]NOK72114.1 GNAT family N-acetyltransferase [Chloroflexi bacterium AL-N5]